MSGGPVVEKGNKCFRLVFHPPGCINITTVIFDWNERRVTFPEPIIIVFYEQPHIVFLRFLHEVRIGHINYKELHNLERYTATVLLEE